jgi:ABC-type glycerol-3-phosphate transport system permease component
MKISLYSGKVEGVDVLFTPYRLINSFAPLILPAFFGNAFFIFLLRQSFKQIPLDLEDAPEWTELVLSKCC